MKTKIQIKKIGSYFEMDRDGFLINPTSIEKVQEKWRPIVDEIVEIYKNIYGDNLKNVYVRGSVARGEAVEYVSDIDTFAYVDIDMPKSGKNNFIEAKFLEEKYNFIRGVDMFVSTLSNIPEDTVVLNQSFCVYGEPLPVTRLKIGKDLVKKSLKFHKNLNWFKKFLEKDNSDAEIKKYCVWFMKRILRSAFELVMERAQKYTKDLYLSYETFAEYYPERKVEMYEVLDLALNPTADKNKLKEITENLAFWLDSEISKSF